MAASEPQGCGRRKSLGAFCYGGCIDGTFAEEMKYLTTPYFDRAFEKFSPEIQRAFKKQIRYLLADIRHSSLRTKKYGGTIDIWQARVTDTVRFYFQITGDTYRLLHIRKHPK